MEMLQYAQVFNIRLIIINERNLPDGPNFKFFDYETIFQRFAEFWTLST
jgi:hypothetical protein